MSGGWRPALQRRALQYVPMALQVCGLRAAEGVLGALPGAPGSGALCLGLSSATCEQVQRHGLRWLQLARRARGTCADGAGHYQHWRAGPEALAAIGVRTVPTAWPAPDAAYACRDSAGRRWLLLLPGPAQLWLGWER